MKFNRIYHVSGIEDVNDKKIKVEFVHDENPPLIINLLVYQYDGMSLSMKYENDVLSIVNVEDSVLTKSHLFDIEEYCKYLMINYDKV